jgi:hypothetical protein
VTTSRFRTAGALCLALMSALACEDDLSLQATRPNIDVGLETWSISGSPPTFPAALDVLTSTVVPPDANGSFDVAFDVDDEGRLKVIPVSKVVTPIGGNRAVGLRLGTGTYSEIIDAPLAGWHFDSVFTVNPGQTFLVKVQSLFCRFDVRQDIYAKIYVESVNVEERRATLFARVNPNCGFRSFATGIPGY